MLAIAVEYRAAELDHTHRPYIPCAIWDCAFVCSTITHLYPCSLVGPRSTLNTPNSCLLHLTKRHGLLLLHDSTLHTLAAAKSRRGRETIVLAQPWRSPLLRLAPSATFGTHSGTEHEPETLHLGHKGRRQAPHPVRCFQGFSKGEYSVGVMQTRVGEPATCSRLRHRRPAAECGSLACSSKKT